jgi:hypothetical protein
MRRKACLSVASYLIIMLGGLGAAAQATPAASAGENAEALPHKGMSMTQVEHSFGQPGTVLDAVGSPPITRWIYEGYTVYFDQTYVIHSVPHSTPPGNVATAAAR